MEINHILSREPNTSTFKRETFNSQPTPVSFAKIPVYVLTSKDTFSGGEALAYDVQAHKVGKVVGEVTGGGANLTGRHRSQRRYPRTRSHRNELQPGCARRPDRAPTVGSSRGRRHARGE